MITQFFVDATSVFGFGMDSYFLYALAGDDEFEAGVSKNHGYKTFAGAATVFGYNTR